MKAIIITLVALFSLVPSTLAQSSPCPEPIFSVDFYSGNFGYQIVDWPENGSRAYIVDHLPNVRGVVTIPDQIDGIPIVGIGPSAFAGNDQITEVHFPDTLEFISFSSFEGCSGLISAPLPDNLGRIRDRAFKDCTNLSSISFPENLDSIGVEAFQGCTSLFSVNFVGDIAVGYQAFSGIPGLVVSLPATFNSTLDSLRNFGEAEVLLSPDHPTRKIHEGVLFDSEMTTLLSVPQHFEGSYEIPEGVETIKRRAFERCAKLTSVSFPSTLSSIEWLAFAGCEKITVLVLPESITSIGGSAFKNCKGLKQVQIDAQITELGGGVFAGCSELESVILPNGLLQIGQAAFSSCEALTRLDFPASLTLIGREAFQGCLSLERVTIPGSLTTIEYGAFADTPNLVGVDLQNNASVFPLSFPRQVTFTISPENPAYSTVDGILFNKDQTTLLMYPAQRAGSYEIPNTVTEIGPSAFSGTAGLSAISLPEGLTLIGARSFASCTGLASLEIPDNVITIGDRAFADCTGLADFTIPNSVTTLGNGSFAGCTGLIHLVLPDTVTSLGAGSFQGCSGLAEIQIGSGIETINEVSFAGCISLEAISIPSNIKAIHGYYNGAFEGCHRLREVEIAEGVQWIYGHTFTDCTSLEELHLPASVSYLDEFRFVDGCSALTSIVVHPDNASFTSVEGVLFNKDMTKLLRYPGGKSGPYQIPEGVTDISEEPPSWLEGSFFPVGAFQDCRLLTGLFLPETVTRIGNDSFAGCTALSTINLPEGLTSIGFEPFQDCASLEEITLPSSLNWWQFGYYRSDSGFNGCQSLKAIHVAEGNQYLSSVDGILYNAEKTRILRVPEGKAGSLIIPHGVRSVGNLSGCNLLTDLVIPPSVVSVSSSFLHSEERRLNILFLGDADTLCEFPRAPEGTNGITVQHLSCSRGFTSPTWRGYPVVVLDQLNCPAGSWLVGHGLHYGTDLQQDLNGDGVSLLMAYALDLDPHQNLSGAFPRPVINGDSLSITYHSASPGITYVVETSTDLKTWTREGVQTWFNSANLQRSTSSVSLNGASSRYLRLVVRQTSSR